MASLKRILSFTALACVVPLVGCGKEAMLPVAPVPTYAPASPSPSAQVPLDPQAQRLLAEVKARVAVTKNWTALAKADNTGPDGVTDSNTTRMWYKLPDVTAATIIANGNEKKKNTRVLYSGGNDVQLKTYFFGFIPLKITLPVTDSRLVDKYKRTLKETGTRQFFDMMLHPQAQVRSMGPGTSAGEPVELLEVRSPISWKGIEREVVGISTRLMLPVMRDCYDVRGKRIFHLELREMRTNIRLKGDEFKLD